MELLYLIAFYAGVILWMAAPVIVLAVVGTAVISGLGLIVAGARKGGAKQAVMGFALLVFAGGTSYGSYKLFMPGAQAAPTLRVSEPRVRWQGPLPAEFVANPSWDPRPAMQMKRAGTIDRVLTRHESSDGARWEELLVKPDVACQAAWEKSDVREMPVDCVYHVPSSEPGPRFWLESDDREAISFKVAGAGPSWRPVLNCEAEKPQPGHPLIFGRSNVVNNDAFWPVAFACRSEALSSGRLVAALVREGR